VHTMRRTNRRDMHKFRPMESKSHGRYMWWQLRRSGMLRQSMGRSDTGTRPLRRCRCPPGSHTRHSYRRTRNQRTRTLFPQPRRMCKHRAHSQHTRLAYTRQARPARSKGRTCTGPWSRTSRGLHTPAHSRQLHRCLGTCCRSRHPTTHSRTRKRPMHPRHLCTRRQQSDRTGPRRSHPWCTSYRCRRSRMGMCRWLRCNQHQRTRKHNDRHQSCRRHRGRCKRRPRSMGTQWSSSHPPIPRCTRTGACSHAHHARKCHGRSRMRIHGRCLGP
jgi:hypothetical protein